MSLNTPGIPASVGAHLYSYMAMLAHQDDQPPPQASTPHGSSSHSMPADLMEITAAAAPRSAHSYAAMLAAAGDDRTAVALLDRAMYETMHLSMGGDVYNAARNTVENLPASSHLYTRVLSELVQLTQTRASTTHSDLFDRTLKAGRNGSVADILALEADRRNNKMEVAGVEMAFLIVKSLRRSQPVAAVEAEKMYDALIADLIAGKTRYFDLQQFASDVGKHYDQDASQVFMADIPAPTSKICGRCNRGGHLRVSCWQVTDSDGKPLKGPPPVPRPTGAFGTRGDSARLARRAQEIAASKTNNAYLTACTRFSSAGHDVEEMHQYVSLLIQQAPHAHSSRSSLSQWRTVYEEYAAQVDLFLSFYSINAFQPCLCVNVYVVN